MGLSCSVSTNPPCNTNFCSVETTIKRSQRSKKDPRGSIALSQVQQSFNGYCDNLFSPDTMFNPFPVKRPIFEMGQKADSEKVNPFTMPATRIGSNDGSEEGGNTEYQTFLTGITPTFDPKDKILLEAEYDEDKHLEEECRISITTI